MKQALAQVTIRVPAALRDCVGGRSSIALEASDVRKLLAGVERSHPALYRSVCDETGAVRRHINVFVDTTSIRDREGLDTALAPGDVVTILTAVSGG